MSIFFLDLLMFGLKGLIIIIVMLLLLAGILALLGRGKEKRNGKIFVRNLNKKYDETAEYMMSEIFSKKEYKKYLKNVKKKQKETDSAKKNIYVINFLGDIKASALSALREEVTAILNVAKDKDEVVVCLESGGGMVHSYGLAAAQLERIKQRRLALTVAIDKVAASGGYMMACVANKIIAAPFAIIGSIGVLVQMPNFHRFLKEKNIDFEQFSAGLYKRTLTLFGENTEEGKKKLQQEINKIHDLFKNLIHVHRNQIDIDKVATGEYWLGSQALELKLVDEINTSDSYLLEKSKNANVFEIAFHDKKPLSQRLSSVVGSWTGNYFW